MTTSRGSCRDALIVLAVALLLGLARHGHALLGAAPLGDEIAYLCAFDAVRAGVDPHEACPRFLYLPVLAHVGARLTSWCGADAVRLGLRTLVLLGGVGVAWLAAAAVDASRRVRCVVAAVVVLSPPVAEGIGVGNLSAPAAALAWVALFALPRAPWRAGATLGLALLLKPLAVLAPVALAIPRGEDRGATWRAAAAACGVLGLGLLPWPEAASRLAVSGAQHGDALHNVSFSRVLSAVGLDAPAGAIAAAVAVGVALVVARDPIDARHAERRRHAAACGSLLALPVVWNHGFVLVLPVLSVATWRAWTRWRSGAAGDARSRALLALVLVVAGDLAVLGSDLFGELFERDPAAGLPLLVPLLAPTALAAFALAARRQDVG